MTKNGKIGEFICAEISSSALVTYPIGGGLMNHYPHLGSSNDQTALRSIVPALTGRWHALEMSFVT
jgi:hypothetical protein